MGLDLIIERKRKGEAYESDAWEEVVCGRNCYTVRDIILNNISTYDEEKYEAELTIGTLNNLVVKLSEKIKEYNLNDKDTFEDGSYQKTLLFLSDLAKVIYDSCLDYEYDRVEYKYRLINSF